MTSLHPRPPDIGRPLTLRNIHRRHRHPVLVAALDCGELSHTAMISGSTMRIIR